MVEMANFLDMRRRLKAAVGFYGMLAGATEVAPWQSEIANRVPRQRVKTVDLPDGSARSHCATFDAGFFLFRRLTRPGHARGVVRDAELSLRVQHDNSTVPIQSLFQVVHGLLCRPLGQISC